MLYWAEGAKDRNNLCFANSDPAMLSMFIRFLRQQFNLQDEDFTFRINAYTTNGRRPEEIEEFWMEQLDLPSECARKHTFNHFPTSSSGKRANKLPNGVCTLKARRGTRLVQHIFGAIQEYSGIDQPQWLDGTERTKPAA